MKVAIFLTLFISATIHAEAVKSGAIGKETSTNSYEKIDSIVLRAFEVFAVQGFLLDSTSALLTDPALGDSITWDLIGADTGMIRIAETVGSQTSITGKIAYTRCFLRMNYKSSPLDSVFVDILPAPSTKLCIDSTPNTDGQTLHEIVLLSNSLSLFAIWIDEYRNKLGYGSNLAWSVRDTSLLAIDTTGGLYSECKITAKTDIFITEIYYELDSAIVDTIVISKRPAFIIYNRTPLQKAAAVDFHVFDLSGRRLNIHNATNPAGLMIHRSPEQRISAAKLQIR